jgi:hypothetical protein
MATYGRWPQIYYGKNQIKFLTKDMHLVNSSKYEDASENKF